MKKKNIIKIILKILMKKTQKLIKKIIIFNVDYLIRLKSIIIINVLEKSKMFSKIKKKTKIQILISIIKKMKYKQNNKNI